MVVLLRWLWFLHSAVKLQEMKTELLAEGLAINFVIVNLITIYHQNLTDICD